MEYSIGIRYRPPIMKPEYRLLICVTLPERMMHVDDYREYIHNNRVDFVEIFKLEE